MTIQQIKYAIAISEMGSLNKASEVLFVSQPSLTSAIRELEKELNITIFYRSGRGVTLTGDGEEFIQYARAVVQNYDGLLERYSEEGQIKKKFGISTQHYSFTVKSFVELVKHYDLAEYEFAIRETKTREVIDDVVTGRSELGILYLSDFNRKAIEKTLSADNLSFTHLIDCDAYVYVWREHPLSSMESISLNDLRDYPCLSFEQGAGSSYYFAEELLSTEEYPRLIKCNDRATVLNLMVGLNGYTLCSGIISEELNGPDYLAIPLHKDPDFDGVRMEIGYIAKKNLILSHLALRYIEEIKKYLKNYRIRGSNI